MVVKFIDLVYTGPVAYFASDPDCDGFSVSSSTDIINETDPTGYYARILQPKSHNT